MSSTPPSKISVYSITQNSAVVEWYVNGGDTNFTDILCNDSDGKTVWSTYGVSTRNSQYYSDKIVGLTAGHTYHCYIRTKEDLSGGTDSEWVYVPDFTTLDDGSGNPSTTQAVQQLVYVKTNIAGYFFDAILQTNYTRSLTITQHPVETGAAISDHAYVNPVELTMQIGMSDVMKSIIPGQFSQGASRSLTAFEVLAQLQSQRIPMQVMTRLGSFSNMLIETIAVPDDYTTQLGLKATVTLREVFVATVKTVKISARPQVTDSTPGGTREPQTPNKSVVRSIEDSLGPAAAGVLQNF